MEQSPRDPRFITLVGAHNFRRIEGWRSTDGRRLRSGRLFRSSGLHALTDQDSETVASLSISYAFDLRSAAERTNDPSRWHPRSVPDIWVGAECAAAADLTAIIAGAEAAPGEIEEHLKQVYAAFPEDLAQAVAAVFQAMLGADEPTVLVHCAAGKDRTGFVVATILRALDIGPEDVIADYLLTNETFEIARRAFSRRLRIAQLEARNPGAIEALLGAHRHYLENSDAAITSRWGSFDTYLEEAVGLDDGRRQALRERYLEPA